MKYKHLVTIGHLDHGKSSLLGRLLWDMGRVDKENKSHLLKIGGKEGRQFAYVLDSKKEERGRGITIDIGHNKLLVDGFSFVFSDAPGHEVFLDKAFEGIEESDGAICVIAADQGIQKQTRTHLRHARQVGIKDIVVCINKMDLVNYSQTVYERILNDGKVLWQDFKNIQVLPTSALKGQNITKKSQKMKWYSGPSFLQSLKNLPARTNTIDELIDQSKEIISKGADYFNNPVMLWAGGKDSTAEIAIARDLFGNKFSWPVLFIDTTWKFTETYEFIERMSKKWQLNLKIVTNRKAIEKGINPWSVDHFRYCHELKTKPLLKTIRVNKYDGVFVAIRWDEHGIRGKEQYFSQRSNPSHTRIHPMLHWSEKEIWEFTKTYHVPYNSLYDKEEHNGLVYRSIGCWPFTKPVPKGAGERSGRAVDKERLMEDLRSLGYM